MCKELTNSHIRFPHLQKVLSYTKKTCFFNNALADNVSYKHHVLNQHSFSSTKVLPKENAFEQQKLELISSVQLLTHHNLSQKVDCNKCGEQQHNWNTTYTSPKTNMDTQNDALEKVTPF